MKVWAKRVLYLTSGAWFLSWKPTNLQFTNSANFNAVPNTDALTQFMERSHMERERNKLACDICRCYHISLCLSESLFPGTTLLLDTSLQVEEQKSKIRKGFLECDDLCTNLPILAHFHSVHAEGTGNSRAFQYHCHALQIEHE